MLVLGIDLLTNIAIPFRAAGSVTLAQFPRMEWVAVDQPRDRGEEKTDRYSTHQYSRHALKRPQESPPAGKSHVAVTDGGVTARGEVKREFPRRKALQPVETRPQKDYEAMDNNDCDRRSHY
jgi:hypothetical protein